jgi:hypothetical protein
VDVALVPSRGNTPRPRFTAALADGWAGEVPGAAAPPAAKDSSRTAATAAAWDGGGKHGDYGNPTWQWKIPP